MCAPLRGTLGGHPLLPSSRKSGWGRCGGQGGKGEGPAKAPKELKCFSLSFGHLMRRTDSSEETLMLGKIEGRRRRG